MAQEGQIIHKISPSRMLLALAVIAVGIGLVIFNFTPNEAGIVTISLGWIALEAVLIIGGGILLFQGFKTEFCAVCNQALSLDSKIYPVSEEQKLLDYVNNHDKAMLASATPLPNYQPENFIELRLNYCKTCKNVGYAEVVKVDENAKTIELIKTHPIDRKHFD